MRVEDRLYVIGETEGRYEDEEEEEDIKEYVGRAPIEARLYELLMSS